MAQVPRDALFAYSDGSKIQGGTAWAVLLWKNGRKIAVVRQKLASAEVYDAKLRAVVAALLAVKKEKAERA